jgi:hypothetical protein
MTNENGLFTKAENIDYYYKMCGLVLRGLDYTTQTFLAMYRPEESSVAKMEDLVSRRQAEICERESIISNG